MRSDVVPGTNFPDYELSDQTAKRRKLSELENRKAGRTGCAEKSQAFRGAYFVAAPA
jgi:hypothetical protein